MKSVVAVLFAIMIQYRVSQQVFQSSKIQQQLQNLFGSLKLGKVIEYREGQESIILPEGTTTKVFEEKTPVVVSSQQNLTQEQIKGKVMDRDVSQEIKEQIKAFIDPLAVSNDLQFTTFQQPQQQVIVLEGEQYLNQQNESVINQNGEQFQDVTQIQQPQEVIVEGGEQFTEVQRDQNGFLQAVQQQFLQEVQGGASGQQVVYQDQQSGQQMFQDELNDVVIPQENNYDSIVQQNQQIHNQFLQQGGQVLQDQQAQYVQVQEPQYVQVQQPQYVQQEPQYVQVQEPQYVQVQQQQYEQVQEPQFVQQDNSQADAVISQIVQNLGADFQN